MTRNFARPITQEFCFTPVGSISHLTTDITGPGQFCVRCLGTTAQFNLPVYHYNRRYPLSLFKPLRNHINLPGTFGPVAKIEGGL